MAQVRGDLPAGAKPLEQAGPGQGSETFPETLPKAKPTDKPSGPELPQDKFSGIRPDGQLGALSFKPFTSTSTGDTPWDSFVNSLPDKDPFGFSDAMIESRQNLSPEFSEKYRATQEMFKDAEREWENMGPKEKAILEKAGASKMDYMLFRVKDQFNARFPEKSDDASKLSAYEIPQADIEAAKAKLNKPSRPPKGMVRVVDENTGKSEDIPKKDFLNNSDYEVFGSKKDRAALVMGGSWAFHMPVDDIGALEDQVGGGFKFDRDTVSIRKQGNGVIVIDGKNINGDRCSITISPGQSPNFTWVNESATNREGRYFMSQEGAQLQVEGDLPPDLITNLLSRFSPWGPDLSD